MHCIYICPKHLECSFCRYTCRTIGTVHCDIHTMQINIKLFTDKVQVVFNASFIWNNFSNCFSCSVIQCNFTINIVFNQIFYITRQLNTILREYLDSIIIEWIMRCRNHCTTFKIFIVCQIADCWCWTVSDKICITSL